MRQAIPGRQFLLALLISLWGVTAAAADTVDGDATLDLIRHWVHGRYDNSQQAERDLADARIPDDRKHRLMHQLFVPVPVSIPAIPGYLVFQQSSIDGSEDPETIVRVGLLQFFVDDAGVVHQRELNFRDLDAFKNAHHDPERLRSLTLEDFRFDPGCDFLLASAPSAAEISGPIKPGACRILSQGLNREIVADDAVSIRENEYWFLGRYVDEAGNVVWGNASDVPVKMIRLPPASSDR